MLLLAGERILLQEDTSSLFRTHRGVLYLTNCRLVQEHHARRFFQPGRSETTLEVPLDHIRNAHVSSPMVKLPLLGRETLQIETSVGHHHELRVSNPSAWRDQIAALRAQARPATPPAAQPPVAGTAQSVPPSVGAPTVYMRCRYCGKIGNMMEGRCPSCGAQY